MENTEMQQLQSSEPQEETNEGNIADAEMTEGNPGGDGGEKTPFQRLIENEYRQEYEAAVSQRIQAAIQQRFRNHQNYRAQWEAYQPVLEALRERYGAQDANPQEIADRMREESARGQAEQAGQGMQSAALRGHFSSLVRQAEEMKQTFPDFDLMREMNDPEFLRLTAPGYGVSVKKAFYAVHGEELQRDSMRYAAMRAEERVAASVRAGAGRPVENGLQRQNPVILSVDIARMDKKTREAYRQRIRNGEEINFRDKI